MASEIRRNPPEGGDRIADTNEFSFARSFRRHGGMRYYVLWLLASKPMKGSEIMDEIQKQTMGWWRPSPGTVYPLLSSLEKEGMISRMGDTRYSITDQGKGEIGFDRNTTDSNWSVDRIVSDLEGYMTYLEEERDTTRPFLERIRAICERLQRLVHEMERDKDDSHN